MSTLSRPGLIPSGAAPRASRRPIRPRRGGPGLVLAIGCLVAAACTNGAPTSPSGSPGAVATGSTITITAAGVTPRTVQIRPGERVTFINNDMESHEMSSDQHPDHLECPSINQVGFIMPGQTKETGNFVVAETCTFHDHLRAFDAGLRGTIVVTP